MGPHSLFSLNEYLEGNLPISAAAGDLMDGLRQVFSDTSIEVSCSGDAGCRAPTRRSDDEKLETVLSVGAEVAGEI